MKKIIIILSFFTLPFNAMAYSNMIMIGGETVGISIDSNGLVIVGFYKVSNIYYAKKYFQVGDAITHVNDNKVNDINELIDNLESLNKEEVTFKVRRNNKNVNINVKLEKENGKYKTGIYVKDNIKGLGTLTYVDPITKIYGALGHEITFNETNEKVEVKSGSIFESIVNKIDRSTDGYVGSKGARINYNKILGNIKNNTIKGIFGFYNSKYNKKLYEVIPFEDIHLGKAYIITTIDENIKEYEIEIISKNNNSKDNSKAISFKIVDKELLSKTGGIIQGMSGSPIIQDNKVLGACTFVVINDVQRGYAIHIETMLKEGDKLL